MVQDLAGMIGVREVAVFPEKTSDEKPENFSHKIYRSRAEFLREINRKNLEPLIGWDRVLGRAIIFLNYPIAYSLTFLSLAYSPEKKGYAEI